MTRRAERAARRKRPILRGIPYDIITGVSARQGITFPRRQTDNRSRKRIGATLRCGDAKTYSCKCE
jgi:hypothetical protein